MTTTIEPPELITPEEPGGPTGLTARRPRRRGRPRPPRGPDRDPQLADLDRPQGHRQELHDHLAGALLHRRDHGPGHPGPAGRPHLLAGLLPDLQRAVHHARQPDAVPVRRALRLRRPGQLHRAPPGGRPRHGLPPPQRPLLLAVPGRLDHHDVRLPGRRRGGQLRLGGLRPAVQRHQLARGRCRPVADGAGPHRVLGHLHRRQPVRHHLLPAGPGDDHVPGPHLLVEHAGHRPSSSSSPSRCCSARW